METANFADWILNSIILIISCGLTAHICHGYGTSKWRETFIGLCLTILVCVQMYHLLVLTLYFPINPYIFKNPLYRKDCLSSTKGGKRPNSSFQHFDLNPCFCHNSSRCVSTKTGALLSSDDTCPVDGTAVCRAVTASSSSPREIPMYLDYRRDCSRGEGRVCSLSQPCVPCDREHLPHWGSGRCRSCSSDFEGDCKYIPGVGPYCWEHPGSKTIVPCKKCCTDKDALFVNGTCY